MPKIVVDCDSLASRGRLFTDLLSPLLRSKKEGVATNRWPSGNSGFIIAAYHGQVSNSFNEARFSTSIKKFQGQYFEIWNPTDHRKLEKYFLYRAYLNIYADSKEYVCLHSDPEEDEDSPSGTKACYRRCPHVHVKIEHHSISKSHIAINHGYLNQIMMSPDDFFRAMKNGIELISDEILRIYEE